jgi:asparagine synthase (glutamine-hydrolysing)
MPCWNDAEGPESEPEKDRAMSVQFGRWSFGAGPADISYLQRVDEHLAPHAPGKPSQYVRGDLSLLFRAFHTTKESHLETQPHTTPSGIILMWDGRLDNRGELARLLWGKAYTEESDLSIASTAYESWGIGCFPRLVGDWALSAWNPREKSLTLAVDPMGIRHLFYYVERDRVTWSSVLDAIICLAGPFELEPEYVAGWFSLFPAGHLTPFAGVHSVPAASFVVLRPGNLAIETYWNFDPRKQIRYRFDEEYEEHFREVFSTSVRRRLRSDAPVLAELSGGVDSCSIVCVADQLLSSGSQETTRLDTISYYDNSEPNWNEFPYFMIVEQQRRRPGYHIDLTGRDCFPARPGLDDSVDLSPGSAQRGFAANREFAECLERSGSHVLLSGVGGDEIMGGVPTPVPELADLVASARLLRLARELKRWALAKRVPWIRLLWETVCSFFPRGVRPAAPHRRPPPWLNPVFVKKHCVALSGYEDRLKLLGPRPSFQENLSTLEGLRRQLACSFSPSRPACEVRYPYLDRDLLEFMFAIPRDQVARPGQRRSLMRRALAGVVPREILERKRKAYVVRSPMVAVARERGNLAGLCGVMVSASLGIVLPGEFERALNLAQQGQEVPLAPLLRTIMLEHWLRNIARAGILAGISARPASEIERPAAAFNLS